MNHPSSSRLPQRTDQGLPPRRAAISLLPGLLSWLVAWGSCSAAAPLPVFDFTRPDSLAGWFAQHDLQPLTQTDEGLLATLQGADPYLVGPARNYPAETPLWCELRLRSDRGGSGQLFFFRDSPQEPNSVRFDVPAGEWTEIRLRIPPLGDGFHLRLDPPGDSGECRVARIAFAERLTLSAPAWPKPILPAITGNTPTLSSGILTLRHDGTHLGGFRLAVTDRELAVGFVGAPIGYQAGAGLRWIHPAPQDTTVTLQNDRLLIRWQATDPDGARWDWQREFRPSATNAFAVENRVEVSADRHVVFLPVLLTFSGLDTFGTNKHQALLSGVEYLANEPSSSEADLRGPAARRLVPDTLKLTAPLMALEQAGIYVALAWEPAPNLAAVFDSPDRQFNSGAHLLGLLAPGSDGLNRDEGSLLPYGGFRLEAGRPWVAHATVLGGPGKSVVAAVQHYVARVGLPELPRPNLSRNDYFRLASRGWLDSKIRRGPLFSHAHWPGFNPGPAADAALWMDWLADQLDPDPMADRLRTLAQAALAEVPRENYGSAAVGHVRSPAPALVYGAAEANLRRSEAHAAALLQQFSGDGVILYQAREGQPDFASTHWEREANGLAASTLAQLLETAAFSGQPELQQAAVRHLRALLRRFQHTVPRGAQTWEIPLHTPDILASAYLVKASVLGYQLTGDPWLLEQAQYWAWTGVPFVYLTPPTPQPVGLYNTIAVLGATGWVAPVWLGQPVQWCGLVYADALRLLAPHDPAGPWKTLAHGIALAGMQHSWPDTDADRVGLLPDFFLLRSQRSDGPAINPATLLTPAAYALLDATPYDFIVTPASRVQIQGAGSFSDLQETPESLRFRFTGWHHPSSQIVLHQVATRPGVRVNGQSADDNIEYRADRQRLVIPAPPQAEIELLFPQP